MTPDINVLGAASRSDHPHHSLARDWLEEALAECEAGGRLEVLPMVAAGFLRLVTKSAEKLRRTKGARAQRIEIIRPALHHLRSERRVAQLYAARTLFRSACANCNSIKPGSPALLVEACRGHRAEAV